jgi:hypothetical protein
LEEKQRDIGGKKEQNDGRDARRDARKNHVDGASGDTVIPTARGNEVRGSRTARGISRTEAKEARLGNVEGMNEEEER